MYKNDSEIMKAIHDSTAKRFLYISTFGFYREADEFAAFNHKDKRLIVGIPRYNPCVEGCPNCTLKYMNTLKYTFKRMFDMHQYGFDVRVGDKVHMKVFMFGHTFIIGGINLTGSSFIDMSIKKHLEEKEKRNYINTFDNLQEIDMRAMYNEVSEKVHWESFNLTFGAFKGRDLSMTNSNYIKWFKNSVLSFDSIFLK